MDYLRKTREIVFLNEPAKLSCKQLKVDSTLNITLALFCKREAVTII